jgi:threonine dehydratase
MSASPGTALADEVAARIAAGESAAAAQVVSTLARHTPVLTSHSLSERCGGRLLLKAENLQRTGSFKLRGAVHKISRLTDATGVVAGSAGNHGQSLAYAARAEGIPCEVFMPREAPVAKVAAVEAFGGIVHLEGDSVDACVAAARARAQESGAGFVHPFDDPDIILGQSTLGLELLEDVPDLRQVVVPVGGGGLISGIAGVVKRRHPDARIVGVQVDACAPFPESLKGSAPITATARSTIADGIAIKRPGDITLPLVQRWVDEMVVVSEEDIADAMVWLLEDPPLHAYLGPPGRPRGPAHAHRAGRRQRRARRPRPRRRGPPRPRDRRGDHAGDAQPAAQQGDRGRARGGGLRGPPPRRRRLIHSARTAPG